jgi:glyoxalase superfamily protein
MDEEVVPVLHVKDAARAVTWYGRLGFVKEWEHWFEPGFPLFVSVSMSRTSTRYPRSLGVRSMKRGSPVGNAI